MLRRLKAALDVLSTLAVLVAAGVIAWKFTGSPADAARPPALIERVGGTIQADQLETALGDGSVVLVEFSDYQCPFCARHAQLTAPRLRTELIDKKQLSYVVLNFPLDIHPQAHKAGEAAECARQQGKFWEMHDRLFHNAQEMELVDLWKRADDIGLDRPRFQKCVESGDMVQKVRADVALGKRLGVKATPAFFVGRRQSDGNVALFQRLNGAAPFEEFAKVIKSVP